MSMTTDVPASVTTPAPFRPGSGRCEAGPDRCDGDVSAHERAVAWTGCGRRRGHAWLRPACLSRPRARHRADDAVRQSTGINWLGALGALVALPSPSRPRWSPGAG